MSSLKNKVQLIGNVGNDPEVTTLDNGTKVVNLSLATSETYTNKEGEKVTSTEWHRLVFWNKTAEIVEKFVTKGKQIAVEGKLRTTKSENKDGVTMYNTKINCHEIVLLGSKEA